MLEDILNDEDEQSKMKTGKISQSLPALILRQTRVNLPIYFSKVFTLPSFLYI